MSILSTISSMAVSGIWKVGAIATLVVAAGAFGGWALAAHDRNVARAQVEKLHTENGDLKAAMTEQNIAVGAMAASTAEAVRRREAAEKAAAGAIARAPARAAAVSASTAPDCAGVLNEAWEGWK
jgi:hypothetical protein